MTATQQNLLRAWEENQKAGWAIAAAIVALRDGDGSPDSRGDALAEVDRARRLHTAANSMLFPAQQDLATSLQTSQTSHESHALPTD